MTPSPAIESPAARDPQTPSGDLARDAQLAAALARCATGDRSALQVLYDL